MSHKRSRLGVMARPASVPGRRLQPAFSFAPTTRNAHGTLPSTSNQSLMTCSARAEQRVYNGERTVLENRCRDLEDQLSQRDIEVKELQQLTEGLRAELLRCDETRNSLREELDQVQRESGGPCVICLDEIAQYAVVPCGHLAICSQCCLGESGTCPVCRRRSMGLLRIFIP